MSVHPEDFLDIRQYRKYDMWMAADLLLEVIKKHGPENVLDKYLVWVASYDETMTLNGPHTLLRIACRWDNLRYANIIVTSNAKSALELFRILKPEDYYAYKLGIK